MTLRSCQSTFLFIHSTEFIDKFNAYPVLSPKLSISIDLYPQGLRASIPAQPVCPYRSEAAGRPAVCRGSSFGTPGGMIECRVRIQILIKVGSQDFAIASRSPTLLSSKFSKEWDTLGEETVPRTSENHG